MILRRKIRNHHHQSTLNVVNLPGPNPEHHRHEWIIWYFLQFRCSSYLYCDRAITPHVEYANKAVQRLREGARPEKLITKTVKRVKVFILPKTKILHTHKDRESIVRGQDTIIHGRVGFDLRMYVFTRHGRFFLLFHKWFSLVGYSQKLYKIKNTQLTLIL